MCAEFNCEAYQGGTLFRRKKENSYEAFLDHFSKILKLKAEGPHGVDRPGVVYYLKRQLSFDSTGVEIAISSKYIPKLVALLGLENKRSRGVPTHATLEAYSAAEIKESDRLDGEEGSKFRSGLGICLYIAQERVDVQFAVRLLSSYMANPTKNAMNALKKLASYLQLTGDTIMKYNVVNTKCTVFTRWQHLDVEGQPTQRDYVIELFSDSDWASSKTTRRSTSSGVIFLNGHCIHSHSRAQASIATGLLVEGIAIKQALQFLLRCSQCMANNNTVEMKLFLDSTSAQAFFQRLGPGRAKHLSTRMLWTQECVRKGWFKLARISTKWNPADLNTKPLSRERRELLSRMIGLWSDSYGEQVEATPSVRRILKLLLMTSMLKGCEQPDDNVDETFWLIVLLLVIYLMLNNINKLRQDNTALQRSLSSRAIQMERDELRRGRRDSDDEDSDDDDDDYPDGTGGRRTRDLGGGYFAVPACGSRGDIGTKIPAKTGHGGTMDQAKVCGTTTKIEQQWELQRAVLQEVQLREKKKLSAKKKELKKKNVREMRKKKLSQRGM